MTTAVELLNQRRLQKARAEMDAQRLADALLKARGEQGQRGPRGPKGDKPDHEWVGTALRFEKPDGEWGDLVDLRGPKGARGDRGAGGGGSGIGALADASLPVLDSDYLVLQRAGRLYRISIALLKDVFGEGGTTPAEAVTVDGDPVTVDGEPVEVTT